MPRRMNRSDRTSITSIALSLRATRIARHSWVNSSSTLSIRYLRPSWVRSSTKSLHLLGFQPAELLAPPIIRQLAHPDLADCVHHVLAFVFFRQASVERTGDRRERDLHFAALGKIFDKRNIRAMASDWFVIYGTHNHGSRVSAVTLSIRLNLSLRS